jgi:hypothetical protein
MAAQKPRKERHLTTEEVEGRLRIAFELNRFVEDALRRRIRRHHPGMSPAAVEAEIAAWYRARPPSTLRLRVSRSIRSTP